MERLFLGIRNLKIDKCKYLKVIICITILIAHVFINLSCARANSLITNSSSLLTSTYCSSYIECKGLANVYTVFRLVDSSSCSDSMEELDDLLNLSCIGLTK